MEQDSERRINTRGIKILVVGHAAVGLFKLLELTGDSPEPIIIVPAEVGRQLQEMKEAANRAAEELKEFAELALTKVEPPECYLEENTQDWGRVNKAPFKGQSNKYNSKQINRPRLRVQQHR